MFIVLIVIIILIIILSAAYLKYYTADYSVIGKLLTAATVLLLTISIIIYPEESFNAALDGLKTWFNIVCPSLLPFFIGSELLINLGIVNFLGALLEPVIRPLFNVPGNGSFPFIMSITSGYPVGPKIIAQMYNSRSCTKTEAQRMLSFCSTSGPLFMIGAVGIGMIGVRGSGVIIALAHYLGALTVGIVFRFYKFKEGKTNHSKNYNLKRAFSILFTNLKNQTKPLGLMLGESVRNSLNSIATIGGFIILFSVIIKLLILSGSIKVISDLLSLLLSPIGIKKELLQSLSSGICEMTIGTKLAASAAAPLSQKILVSCAIISWSGLSIHAQVASMISGTDLNMKLYIVSKAMHSIMSAIYAYIILSLLKTPLTLLPVEVIMYYGNNLKYEGWTTRFAVYSGKCLFAVAAILCIGIIFNLYKYLKKHKST